MRRTRDQRAFNVAYYRVNRAAEIQRVRRRQTATTEFLRQLREVPCADCGGRFVGHQMDFDHRDPATKRFWLCSGRAALKSRDEILAEAAKCDVVCANCHRLRSRRRHRAWLASRAPSTEPRTEGHRIRWRYHADVLDQLRSVPCADCGGRFAQCSMDFDHRDPSTKVARAPLSSVAPAWIGSLPRLPSAISSARTATGSGPSNDGRTGQPERA